MLSPAALVQAAQRGDKSAFAELLRRYRPRIYALALHLTGDAHDADDVAQEAFLRAYRDWQRIRQPSAWVRKVAVRRAGRTVQRRLLEARPWWR